MSYASIILAAAKSAGVSGSLLLAICTHESGLKNALVLNDKGSPTYGICQIKSAPAFDMGFKGDPDLLMRPEINAKYAALYLKHQLDRYDGDECKAVSAYNAGTFKESKKHPGQPFNIAYIQQVQDTSDEQLFGAFTCQNSAIAQMEK
jgi:soluble lytic murein transglycosylase-like protein